MENALVPPYTTLLVRVCTTLYGCVWLCATMYGFLMLCRAM